MPKPKKQELSANILNVDKKMKKIKGTVKFEVYMRRGKSARKELTRSPEHFVYNQWGWINLRNEEGKTVGSEEFKDYGGLIKFINDNMRKTVMDDIKKGKKWRD